MNRQEKEALVESLKQDFSDSQASFVVVYRGLSVDRITELRRGLRGKGGKLKITKARLMKLAIDGDGALEGLRPYLGDQIGLVFAGQEPTTVAKEICDFAKKNKTFSIVAGSFDSKILDQSAVVMMASLPSREILLAQVASVMQMPITQFTRLLHMMIARLLFVLKRIEEKKRSEEE